MNSSPIFHTNKFKEIESKIKRFLNSQQDFISARSASSPRAIGDAIQDLLADHFENILEPLCNEYSADFARRAMADLAFKDVNDNYYIVDVKSHRKEAGFHMPNLTSVERLSRFYEDNKNYFTILSVSYTVNETKITAKDIHFVPIEFLSWQCLTIGALGWGQIQIANSDHIIIDDKCTRKSWMLQLCDTLLEFYPKEIGKINNRIRRFERVRRFWEQHDD